MKKIKKTIILILALCSFIGVYSQTKTTIRGKVIDQKDKSAIIGATIVESDKDNRVVNGTVTDIDGNFVYQMKNPLNSMKVTVIGFQSKAFKPNPLKSVVIELVSSDVELNQVTITSKTKSDNSLTNVDARDNATSRVKVDLMDMKQSGFTSAFDALQGKVAGLDIISASGDPGSGSQIVIRGLSSIGNNKPLIVVDGIAQENAPPNFSSSSDVQDISNMVNIALQDIKSIEILKDAGSTAVYGSKGADGVLLIETYRGKMGKVQFDYTYKNSINFQPRAIPMLNGNEYITLQLEELANQQGVFDLPREIAYDRDYADFYNYSANTDWLAAVTKNSVTNDNFFKISGGGEKTRYYTSFSYVNEGGTTINTASKVFSTRVNLDYFLSKNLNFSVQFNYVNNKTEGNVKVGDQGKEKNIREIGYQKAPNMSIWEHDQNGYLTGEYFTRNFDKLTNYQGTGLVYFNPVAVANLGKQDGLRNNFESSFKLKYTIKDWLIFKETVAFQYEGRKSNNFLPYNAVGANWFDWNVNKAEEVNTLFSSLKTESQFVFYVPFKTKDHELTGVTTWATNQTTNDDVNTQSYVNPSVNIQDPAIGSRVNWMGSSLVEKRDLGAVFNLNYKYKDRYMLQATSRADGNSAFGASRRWGVFKSLAFAWRFSSEPLLKNCESWLSESKIKASWGTSGRPPGDWPTYPRFSIFNTTSPSNYITNAAVVPTSIQLDNLKWESIESYDFGIELNLFKDRLYLSADAYTKKTTDMLFQDYKIPASSGFDKLVWFNGGGLDNKGWEFMTNYKVVRTKDWMVTVDFNISQNVNTFTKLPANFNTEKDVNIVNGKYPMRLVEGEPIGSFFGFRYLGVYPSDQDAIARDVDGNILYDSQHNPVPMNFMGSYIFKGGDAKYEDINHDGKIDINDAVYIGDSNPKFIGGFGTSLRYKQWDLSFQFQYRVGFDIINMTALNTEGMNDKNNQSKAVLNRWRVQGQNEPGMLPRAYMNNPANNLGSDRYIEKGDFLRFNNVSLKYQLTPELCNKLNLQSASFQVGARKLFTLTNYSGQDPEVGQDAKDPFWIGADNANTPPPKMVTFSFSVGF